MSHMKEHVNVKYKSIFIAELNKGTKSYQTDAYVHKITLIFIQATGFHNTMYANDT